MKTQIDKIGSLIEGWCKKKLVFACPLLLFGTVGKAHAHCRHLQITQSDPQTEICKRVHFFSLAKDILKYIISLILLVLSINVFAQDYYITNSDLNLRSGTGINCKSLLILSKGDTVQLIDGYGNYWVKVQYKDKVGYCSKHFLKKIQFQEEPQKEEITVEDKGGTSTFLIVSIVLISVSIIITQLGKKYRNLSLAKFFSFFFGTFGLQKFYLGQTNKGTLLIMCCWTFIPTIIGFIDFVKLASMDKDSFNVKYNDSFKKHKNRTIKSIKETKDEASSLKINIKEVQRDSIEHATSLYKKGLYVDEILNQLIEEDYKMPNNDDIRNFNQVKYLIRKRIPNASFEVKPKIKSKKKQENFEISYLEHNNGDNSVEKNRIETKKINSDSIDQEFKRIAEREYPKDLIMQEHAYIQHKESKTFMLETTDVEIRKDAIKKCPNIYFMQEHTYKQQVKLRTTMLKTTDVEIRKHAESERPDDNFIQELADKQQSESKSYMAKTTNKEVIKLAEQEYPADCFVQENTPYKEQIALEFPKKQSINEQYDETIIDVNSEKLDLNVEKVFQKENQIKPPYWSHSYICSYDEINNASKEQKEFYLYFKDKFFKSEFVDIQENTNYAFILYFDLLNEYENHKNIKLLEEQVKFLGEICPKIKSYSLLSMQDLLRKRTDSYSIDKLSNLQESNYRLEHGYFDYDPDAHKLGKQYKDKLGLNKQEVAWLNKFWNPDNVFISIEGCCIATIKQYLVVLKSLNKKLKSSNTSVAKEVDFFKEKIFEYKEIADSYLSYYDKSCLKKRVETEIYLTIFKRTENSVREFYGHKRKVGNAPYYDFKGEFETRIGKYVDELVAKHQDKIALPDIETQVELNAQNVNRWKNEFSDLKNSFQNEEKSKFIEEIIYLEEINKKNPNIENIFFEASNFIAKYDGIQSLKYYAKYIFYDLKSKKFDNKEFTKTAQKSLFRTEEQINDFRKIIADLIETSDIKMALDEIDRIYIPKRKKIKLDKAVIKEVEQKHDGTVELLSEYLEPEQEEIIKQDVGKEEIGISVVPANSSNSIFISDISIGKIQEELIKMIALNSFEINQQEVENYAMENGMFKNQLIDSINEACEEHLDGEALIEEDEENYIIEEFYYKEILV